MFAPFEKTVTPTISDFTNKVSVLENTKEGNKITIKRYKIFLMAVLFFGLKKGELYPPNIIGFYFEDVRFLIKVV